MFKPKPLTVTTVFQGLSDIAKASGNQVSFLPLLSSVLTPKSQARKVGIINRLLASCEGNEAKFIIRSLEGKLRIGLAERSLVIALAHAMVLKENGEQHCLRRAHLTGSDGKKLSPESMSQKLEEGAEIVKAVYR